MAGSNGVPQHFTEIFAALATMSSNANPQQKLEANQYLESFQKNVRAHVIKHLRDTDDDQGGSVVDNIRNTTGCEHIGRGQDVCSNRVEGQGALRRSLQQ